MEIGADGSVVSEHRWGSEYVEVEVILLLICHQDVLRECWHMVFFFLNLRIMISQRIHMFQAEIQTERQRILLLDTSKSPVESIRAGGRYDFIVEHDVKELGAHT